MLLLAAVLAACFAQPSASADSASEEGLMWDLVNRHRADVGLVTLSPHAGLGELARVQSQRMASDGDIFHNARLFEEMSAYADGWSLVGENVGVGVGAVHVETLFVRSAKHLANIEGSEWTHLGVGAALGQDGLVYFTQVFASFDTAGRVPPPPEVAPAELPRQLPAPEPVPTLQPDPAPAPATEPELAEAEEPPPPMPAPLPRGHQPRSGTHLDGIADLAARLLARLGLTTGPR